MMTSISLSNGKTVYSYMDTNLFISRLYRWDTGHPILRLFAVMTSPDQDEATEIFINPNHIVSVHEMRSPHGT
jgi:hypothetical protein